MGFVSSADRPASRRKRGTAALALCWICGLVFGILVYLSAGNCLLSLMRSTAGVAVSIVSALYVTALPFLISAAAASFSRSALLPICFGKAFLFAFTALGLSQAFGCAGWLLFRLILFTDCTLLPLLYLLWLRLLSARVSGLELAVFLALAILTLSIDYCIISPFWVSLIEI